MADLHDSSPRRKRGRPPVLSPRDMVELRAFNRDIHTDRQQQNIYDAHRAIAALGLMPEGCRCAVAPGSAARLN